MCVEMNVIWVLILRSYIDIMYKGMDNMDKNIENTTRGFYKFQDIKLLVLVANKIES